MFEYIFGPYNRYIYIWLDYYYKVVFPGAFLEAIVFLVDPYY